MTAKDVVQALAKQGNVDDAVFLQRFFKTGKGQYSEGDQFIGVRVPATRAVCRQFKDLPLSEVSKLLDSPVHEHRLAGAIILANAYPRADEAKRQKIFDLYLAKSYAGRINNWDIVDTIKKGDPSTTLDIADILLHDTHDLIYAIEKLPLQQKHHYMQLKQNS